MSVKLTRRGALALLGASLLACKRDATARAAQPRVISISPSTTEALYAIGAGGLAVGRSRYCDYPEAALTLPAVGGFVDPSVEAIVALRPTLVIGARGPAGPSIEGTLRDRGIMTYFPETETIAGIEAMIAGLGERTGHAAEARELTQAIEARLRTIDAAVSKLPRVRCAVLFDVAPLVAAGPGSFPDELIARAGGDNVIKRGGAYPTVGVESLLTLAPEVLIDASGDMGHPEGRLAGLRDAPGLRNLPAIRDDRVRAVAGSVALRPGPRIAEGVAELARAIHQGLVLP